MTIETRRAVWVGLGQVALVLLSVGLGFAASEWRQDRADADRARIAVDAAVREIALNRALAVEARDYHAGMLDVYRSGGVPLLQLRAAPFSNSAWETVQASGVVVDLPYPVVGSLAQIHEVQDTYRDRAQTTLGVIYFGNVFESDRLPTDPSGFASSIEDLFALETKLVGLYDDAFQTVRAAGFAVPDSLLAP